MRFSLRTLLFLVLSLGSGATLCWHWEAWVLERVLEDKAGSLGPLLLSPDGRRLFTCLDETPEICDLDGTHAVKLQGHTAWVWSAAFSRDGGRVVTASPDGTSRVWDAETGAQLQQLDDLAKGTEVYAACFSPDGSSIVTDNSDRETTLWDAATGQKRLEVEGVLDHTHPLSSFSRDGRFLLTSKVLDSAPCPWAWRATLWHLQNGKCLASVTEAKIAVFSPRNGMVATAAPAAPTRVLSLPECAVAQDPSGQAANKIVLEEKVEIPERCSAWDAGAPGSHQRQLGVAGETPYLLFAPDGESLIIFDEDLEAHVHGIATGEHRAIKLHLSSIPTHASFLPDSRRMLVVGDRGGHLYDVYTRERLWHIPQATAAIAGPDNDTIVSAHADRSVRFWRQRRDESFVGVLSLPEFWLSGLCGLLLLYSLIRDWRTLWRKAPAPKISKKPL